MVRGQKDTHRVGDAQEQLQSDRPLQRMDILALAVSERNDAAPCLALEILKDDLARQRQRSMLELMHRIRRQCDGLSEEHLADVDGQ
jgi:hypothetical protein